MARNRRNQIKTIQIVTMALIAIVGAISGWYWWTGPKATLEASIVEKQEQQVKLQTINSRTRKSMVDLGVTGITDALAIYERQGQFLRIMMPPEDTVSRLMTQVTNATRENGVDIGEFTRIPRKEIGGFAASGFAIKLTGRYHDVGAVMSKLLAADRVTHIHKVSIKAVAPINPRGQEIATDLRSLNANSQSTAPWKIDATFELMELGLSKTPTQEEIKAEADSVAKALELAKKTKKKPTNISPDSAAKLH